jgi:hypothetical protein
MPRAEVQPEALQQRVSGLLGRQPS